MFDFARFKKRIRGWKEISQFEDEEEDYNSCHFIHKSPKKEKIAVVTNQQAHNQEGEDEVDQLLIQLHNRQVGRPQTWMSNLWSIAFS